MLMVKHVVTEENKNLDDWLKEKKIQVLKDEPDSCPKLITLDESKFVVFFVGPYTSIYQQLYDLEDNEFNDVPRTLVKEKQETGNFYYNAASISNGTYVVVWSANGKVSVKIYEFSQDSPPVTRNGFYTTKGYIRGVFVTGLATKNQFVVAISETVRYQDMTVGCILESKNGSVVTGPFQIVSKILHSNLGLAALNRSQYVITYVRDQTVEHPTEVAAVIMDSNRPISHLYTDRLRFQSTWDEQANPKVITSPDGEIAICWELQRYETSDQIRCQIFQNNLTITNSFFVSDNKTDGNKNLTMSSMNSNFFIVAYYQSEDENILAQRYNWDGGPYKKPFRINYWGDYINPSVAAFQGVDNTLYVSSFYSSKTTYVRVCDHNCAEHLPDGIIATIIVAACLVFIIIVALLTRRLYLKKKKQKQINSDLNKHLSFSNNDKQERLLKENSQDFNFKIVDVEQDEDQEDKQLGYQVDKQDEDQGDNLKGPVSTRDQELLLKEMCSRIANILFEQDQFDSLLQKNTNNYNVEQIQIENNQEFDNNREKNLKIKKKQFKKLLKNILIESGVLKYFLQNENKTNKHLKEKKIKKKKSKIEKERNAQNLFKINSVKNKKILIERITLDYEIGQLIKKKKLKLNLIEKQIKELIFLWECEEKSQNITYWYCNIL
ncbi:hypothetical protein M0813_03436 [Anaeramoeba flamelloides]|uniref:Transmembrane protein n=1 Tax=Anaeramoeba flamelloides TaxID=1746091 RepID=A0ABQ8Y015_9EUKA|nr:hypothetical protein M0813_03436 [Anaeramoeba flamelloides]